MRDYVRGDPPRLIHWRATAHHGRLMARECDATSVRTVRIVVACRSHGPLTEDALSRVVWTAEEVWRRGWQVRLVTCEPERGPVPPPPLRRSSGRIAPSLFPPPGLRTVEGAVLNRADLSHRLAGGHARRSDTGTGGIPGSDRHAQRLGSGRHMGLNTGVTTVAPVRAGFRSQMLGFGVTALAVLAPGVRPAAAAARPRSC